MYRYILLSLSLLLTIKAYSINKSIYGEDDRLDYNQLSNNEYTDWANSTAAMIPDLIIRDYTDTHVRIKAKMLNQNGICDYQRFARQLTAADCSGFLVAPDKIATAGHCVRNEKDCRNWRWVFDYKVEGKYKIGRSILIENSSVYKCTKIIAREWDKGEPFRDFALLQLDRPVTDRNPLRLRRQGIVNVNDPLVVIGYPSGLPLKFARGGKVTNNENTNFFTSTVDTFAGNSGSVVINEFTGLVEGILSRGGEDYHYEKINGKRCLVPTVCNDKDKCEGEDVSSISSILPYL